MKTTAKLVFLIATIIFLASCDFFTKNKQTIEEDESAIASTVTGTDANDSITIAITTATGISE